MTVAIVVLLAVLVLLVAGALVRITTPKSADWLEEVTLRKVIVHTDGNQSFSGLLAETSDAGLLLRSAVLLGTGIEKDANLPGETWLPRARVLFVQDAS